MKLLDKKLNDLKSLLDVIEKEDISYNDVSSYNTYFENLVSDIRDLKDLIINYKFYDDWEEVSKK